MTLQTPWPICTTCQAIPPAFFHNGTMVKPHQLWPNFSSFTTSASRGCHTCTLLFEAVWEPFKHRLEDESIFLERATTNIDDVEVEAVALTVSLDSLSNRDTWVDEFSKIHISDKLPGFQFVPIAIVKYVTDAEEVPKGARHVKGKMGYYSLYTMY